MIRGKIREWRRKDGRVVREIKVGTGDGEGISACVLGYSVQSSEKLTSTIHFPQTLSPFTTSLVT